MHTSLTPRGGRGAGGPILPALRLHRARAISGHALAGGAGSCGAGSKRQPGAALRGRAWPFLPRSLWEKPLGVWAGVGGGGGGGDWIGNPGLSPGGGACLGDVGGRRAPGVKPFPVMGERGWGCSSGARPCPKGPEARAGRGSV